VPKPDLTEHAALAALALLIVKTAITAFSAVRIAARVIEQSHLLFQMLSSVQRLTPICTAHLHLTPSSERIHNSA
jgi:hypothetical protein